MPYKRTSNINFIISLRNIINNSEIKKNDLIRKDYVTKALIDYANQIKNNEYKWLEYNRFIELEKEIINKNGITESNAVTNLISELNVLSLEENGVMKSENEISSNDNGFNSQIDIQSFDEGNNQIIESKKDEELENDSISSQSDFDGDYNGIPLFDRIIEDDRFVNYKDIISNLKINSGKRSEVTNNNDFSKLTLDSKIKIRYTKKNNLIY